MAHQDMENACAAIVTFYPQRPESAVAATPRDMRLLVNRITAHHPIEREPYEPASEMEDMLDDSERRATNVIIALQLRFKSYEYKTLQNIEAWAKAIVANNEHTTKDDAVNAASLSAQNKIQKMHDALEFEIRRILQERAKRDRGIRTYASQSHL